MIRRLARLAGRAALGVAALFVLAAGFLQTPPGRNLQRQLLLGLLRRGGLEARLEGAAVGLWNLEVNVSGLELKQPGRTAFLTLESGRVRLSPGSLRGRLSLRELQASGLRLSLERSADGRWNLPESASGEEGRPVDLQPFLGARIAVTGTTRITDASSGFEAEAPELSIDWSGDEGRGRVSAGREARFRLSDVPRPESAETGPGTRAEARWRAIALEPASLVREGETLRLEGPALAIPEGRLLFAGAIERLLGTPALRIAATGQLDMARLAGPPWQGRLALHASATGPLASLLLEASARGEGLAVAGQDVEAAVSVRSETATTADGSRGGTAWRADAEGRLAGGRFVATAALPSTGQARAEASWVGLDAARVLGLLSPRIGNAVRGRMTGSLEASWPSDANDLALLSVQAQSTVTALEEAPRAPEAEPPGGGDTLHALPCPGRTSFRLRDRRYALELSHACGDALSLEVRTEGRLAEGDLSGTTLAGPLRVVVTRPQEVLRAAGSSPTGPVAGRLEASLTLSGTLAKPEAMGPVAARGLVVGAAPPVDARAQLVWKEGRVVLDCLEASGPGLAASGAVSVQADGRIDGNATARAALEHWRGVFPPAVAPEGRLDVRAALTGTLTQPEPTLDVEGRDVRFLGQPMLPRVAAQLRASASGYQVSSLLLEQADGRLEATGSWSRGGEAWSLRVAASSFAVLPFAGVSAGDAGVPLRARLDGQAFAMQAKGTGTKRAGAKEAEAGETGAYRAGGTLAASALAWNGEPLGPGTLELSSSADRLAATLRLPDQNATATASVDPRLPHRYRAELRLDGTPLEPLAKTFGIDGLEGSATLRAVAQGESAHSESLRLEGELVHLDGAARGVRFHLGSPARFEGGPDRILIRGLELRGDDLVATLEGELSDRNEAALELHMTGDLRALDPLLKTKDGERLRARGHVLLAARVQGAPKRPRSEATLTIDRGSLGTDEKPFVQNVALQAELREGTLRLRHLGGEARGLRLAATGEAGLGLLSSSEGPLSEWPPALREALRGDGGARLDLRVEPLHASGTTAGPEQDEPAQATVPGAAVSKAASRGDREASRVGPLRVHAHLETNAASLRSLRGRAEVSGLGFSVQGVPLRQEGPVTLELADGRLTLPEVAWKGGLTDLRLQGGIVLAEDMARLGESAVELRSHGLLDLRMLNALSRGLEAGGVARLEADVTGTLARPQILGELHVEDAAVAYRPWRLRLDDLTASVAARPGRVVVEGLSGTLNGGPVTGRGAIELVEGRPRRGQVEIGIAGANVDWPEGARGVLEGTVALRGTESGPVLAGDLTLADAAYRGDPRTLATAKPATLGGEDEGPTLLSGLGLDLHLRTEPDVRVDNPFGTFAFSVDVTARGNAAAPRLTGQVALQPNGFVYWNGRKFTLERGTLDWKAASGLMPFLQARATTRVSSYDVFADFSGPLATADARLVSNPPLGSSEITSLLVTGSTTSGAADSRAIGIASANFLGNLGRHAGLDSVRIDQGDDQSLLSFDPSRVVGETNPAQRLTITKRLSANLEATVSLNLSESGKTTTFVGWKPRPAFEVRVAQRDDYTGSVEVRHDVVLGGTHTRTAPASARAPSRARETVASAVVDDRGQGKGPPLPVELRLRPGKRFRYDDWQRDRGRIEAAAARQGFAEAYVVARREPRRPAPGGGEVALTYVLHRGPRTALEVRGLDSSNALDRDLLRAWATGDYEESIEAEALLRIRAHLADRGHFTPSLEARVHTSAGGEVKTLIVEGAPGPRARGRRIEFEGGPGLPRERLMGLVKGKALLAQAWNDPARLERAAAAEYAQAGFLAAEAKAATPTVEEDEAVMRVAIDEGPPFTRGPLVLRGCAAVPCSEVAAAFGLEPGKTYLPAENEGARARVLELYRRGGWNAAQVRLDGKVRASRASVDVTLSVEEGPRQILREIVEEGGASETRRALGPLLRLSPGSPVVLSEWAAARKRVYETGLVRGVSLEPEPAPPATVAPSAADAPATSGATPSAGSDPSPPGRPEASSSGPAPPAATEPTPGGEATEAVVARLTYDEWPALRLRYGLQLVTEKPLASADQATSLGATAELTRALLLGRALSTGLSAEARADTWAVRGVVSAPRTFGKAFRSSLYLVREREDFDLDLLGGTKPTSGLADTWQLTLEERFRPGHRIELALSYDIQWVKLGIPPLGESPGLSARPARIIPTVLMDGRNDILDPTRGFFSSVTYNHGSELLGSEFDFSRFFTQQFLYRPWPGHLVSASAFRYERSSGDRGQVFVSTDRLAFGGPTTIRGYSQEQVHLAEILAARGATTKVLLLNQELRFPILGDLRGVAFVDYGESRVRLDRAEESAVRLGTGIGVRYSTPVGVLRFDVGYPLRGDGKKAHYYFGLGQAF